jgi:hypothetical protein
VTPQPIGVLQSMQCLGGPQRFILMLTQGALTLFVTPGYVV